MTKTNYDLNPLPKYVQGFPFGIGPLEQNQIDGYLYKVEDIEPLLQAFTTELVSLEERVASVHNELDNLAQMRTRDGEVYENIISSLQDSRNDLGFAISVGAPILVLITILLTLWVSRGVL